MLEKGPRRLVHGVLGSIYRQQPTLPDAPNLLPEVAARWGKELVQAAAAALAEPPPLDLTLANPADTAKWAEQVDGVSLASGHVRIARGTAVETLPGYDEGAWWVQDLAASLPVRLLGEGKGHKALDLCAAPGGKTMQLAAAGWTVTALDTSAKRMERLKRNLERTRLAAETVAADMLKWQPDVPFDAVLLDAPCSATGTFRRHPDVLHRVGVRQIAELVELQAKMLDRAADWVKPGGALVYATCSLEPEEGEAQLAAFLEKHPDFSMGEAALPKPFVAGADGAYRIKPPMLAEEGGVDGFYVALLQKTA
jgi:16S rRNA (cytosine967-C5)-methyltransferase